MSTAIQIIDEIHDLPKDQQWALFDRLQEEFAQTRGMEAAASPGEFDDDWRDAVLGDLTDEFEQCSQPGWDGFGANAVSRETHATARRFVRSLPIGIASPEVCAEADGHLSLEWRSVPDWSISVSVAENGELHYAALFGRNQTYGTEVFDGKAPRFILQLIRRATNR